MSEGKIKVFHSPIIISVGFYVIYSLQASIFLLLLNTMQNKSMHKFYVIKIKLKTSYKQTEKSHKNCFKICHLLKTNSL